MSSVALQGNASGTGAFVVASPNSNSNRTLTLPDATDTLAGIAATQTLTNKTLTSPTITGAVVSSMASSVITSGTAVASTSGTAIDFTGIPSWVKRITVMFNEVSQSGSTNAIVQIGSGSVVASGYKGSGGWIGATNTTNALISTTGFAVGVQLGATTTFSGTLKLELLGSNVWIASSTVATSDAAYVFFCGGSLTLSGSLDRVRITTSTGTTFDAGSINILYE